MEEVFGYIDSIIFAEEGFTVAKLKEPKKSDFTLIVGHIPSLQPGETIHCKGNWRIHPKHGKQFEVESFELQAPSDLVGIQKYLESGMIKGIGTTYASRIVDKFKEETLRILDEEPERLREVSGIGEKRVAQIKKCWDEQKVIRRVMIFLRGHNVSASYAQKIYKAYGQESIEKVTKNPYALAKEIHGIGFKSADRIAQNLGVAKNSSDRIDAGIEFVLWQLSNEGHVCSTFDLLTTTAEKTLEVSKQEIEERLTTLCKKGDLIQEENLIWIKPLYLAEVGIAREILRLTSATCAIRAVELEKAVDWVEQKLAIAFAEQQKNAIVRALQEKFLIITGGPGTGKSTITRAILTITEKLTKRILLAAPTGRAAKRLSEITRKKAFTIHSLLEMDFRTGTFKKGRENPLQCDLIIVDEASMIDTLLMHSLLKAIPSHAKVIFVGDIDQLPSVGPGNVLKDLIHSHKLVVAELKEIFRQAKGSHIILNAHRVNQGIFPILEPERKKDFLYFELQTPEEIAEKILTLITKELPKSYDFHPFEQIQLLSPMKKGIIGTENLNTILQQALNPNDRPIFRFGRKFLIGDKVMQIRNNYEKEVYNGDVGFIADIDFAEQTMQVVFDGKAIHYEFAEIDELILAYAVSIHKYQGSECPCVIIPIHTSHFKLLYRNLLYTGITRGKKLVVLIGTKKAIAICIKNEEVNQRLTGLKKRMEDFLIEQPLLETQKNCESVELLLQERAEMNQNIY
ncbi:MAG: ATP-dependent RecD-like DNA helicase [Chlamydiae bacterium]|nr:ATP-dependent RecD-like DNA helicase [Chlamydiota bacterium]